MIDRSFQLIRTNPALTTNVKVVVSSGYSMYLESFDTNRELSDLKYKHVLLTKEGTLETAIPRFYDGLPSNLAYEVRYDGDNNVVYKDYTNQLDDTYYAGAAQVEDRWYSEEFEYHAPLYVRPGVLPERFIILRVDGPAVYDILGQNYKIGTLTSDNFRSEVIDRWKCVSVFDLTSESDLGYFLDRNVGDSRFPRVPFELDVKPYNFSKWSGIDFVNGTFAEKSVFLDDRMTYDNPHYSLEKYVTDGFRDNGIIFANIINFKFLFDDSPATPESFKKYSSNRYMGFYADSLDRVGGITTYSGPTLWRGLAIRNNIFVDDPDLLPGLGLHYRCPLRDGDVAWDDDNPLYIYMRGDLHKVERVVQDGVTLYRINTDINLSTDLPENDIREIYLPPVTISWDGTHNVVTNCRPVDPYVLGQEDRDMVGDLYLVDIDGIWHVLELVEGHQYRIRTDYAITSDGVSLKYWRGGTSETVTVDINPSPTESKPLVYAIHRVRFVDIKDFDFDRVRTGYANFDYETSAYRNTVEEKLHTIEYRDASRPRTIKLNPEGSDGQFEPVVASSEYGSDDEIFEVRDNDLTDLWRKSGSVCKWGVMGSNSHSDYAYKMNNSLEVGGVFNRTCDPFATKADLMTKNLDYFYRCGAFYSGSTRLHYLNQSTNIETDLNQYGLQDHFDLETYLTSDVDYFEYYFRYRQLIENFDQTDTKIVTKYAVLEAGDDYSPSETCFKGLGIRLHGIDTIVYDTGRMIERVDTQYDGRYNGYKVAIILNDRYIDYTGCTYSGSGGVLQCGDVWNGVTTQCGSAWSEYVFYSVGDVVWYLGSAWINIVNDNTSSAGGIPGANESSTTGWYPYTCGYALTVGWNPSTTYLPGQTVVAGGVYYVCITECYDENPGLYPSWVAYSCPSGTPVSWSAGTVMWYNDSAWINIVDGNTSSPGSTGWNSFGCTFTPPDAWDITNPYLEGELVSYGGSDWVSIASSTGMEPKVGSPYWAGYVCSARWVYDDLPLGTPGTWTGCTLNGTVRSRMTDETGMIGPDENGIHVYVNEKYRNVLVVVNVNIPIYEPWGDLNNVSVFGENWGLYTSTTLSGDTLSPGWGILPQDSGNTYDPSLITAYNFIQSVNNLNDFEGFGQGVAYYVIRDNGDGTVTSGSTMFSPDYTGSTMNLLPGWSKYFPPCMLTVGSPDVISLRTSSYTRSPIRGPKYNIYDKYRTYVNGIPDPTTDVVEPLARRIDIVEGEPPIVPVRHGETVIQGPTVYRFGGAYEPIFKDVEVFNPHEILQECGRFSNILPDELKHGLVECGDTSGTSNDILLKLSERYVRTEHIFLPCEFGGSFVEESLTLSALSFHIASYSNTTGFKMVISLSKGAGVEAGADWYSGGTFVTVYSDTVPVTGAGWITVPFTTVYDYDPRTDGSLVVRIDRPAVSTPLSSIQTYYSVENRIRGLIYHDNSTPVTTPTQTYYRVVLSFGLQRPILNAMDTCGDVWTCDHAEFPSNLWFDTDLSRFGMVDELVVSKVNPDVNMLRIKTTETDRSIYPMVDEYGYDYAERFIFLPPWDRRFFRTTKNELT